MQIATPRRTFLFRIDRDLGMLDDEEERLASGKELASWISALQLAQCGSSYEERQRYITRFRHLDHQLGLCFHRYTLPMHDLYHDIVHHSEALLLVLARTALLPTLCHRSSAPVLVGTGTGLLDSVRNKQLEFTFSKFSSDGHRKSFQPQTTFGTHSPSVCQLSISEAACISGSPAHRT